MPTTPSGEKRLRQNEKRRKRNQSVKTRVRTWKNRILEADSAEEARELLPEAYALLDRAAGKGVIHANKAAREKSRLARHVDSLES